MRRPERHVLDRMADKYEVEPATGCWMWTAGIAGAGYGYVWHEGRMRRAHVVMYEQKVGPVPKGKELGHLCRNRPCINWRHVRPVTHRENIQESELVGRSPGSHQHGGHR